MVLGHDLHEEEMLELESDTVQGNTSIQSHDAGKRIFDLQLPVPLILVKEISHFVSLGCRQQLGVRVRRCAFVETRPKSSFHIWQVSVGCLRRKYVVAMSSLSRLGCDSGSHWPER